MVGFDHGLEVEKLQDSSNSGRAADKTKIRVEDLFSSSYPKVVETSPDFSNLHLMRMVYQMIRNHLLVRIHCKIDIHKIVISTNHPKYGQCH